MGRASLKKPRLGCHQTFAWENSDPAWSWRITLPGRCELRPPDQRSYKSKLGAKRAAMKVARELSIEF